MKAAGFTSRASDQLGFTILELIMVVAILVILASVALPSMRDFIRASNVRSASSDFYTSLVLARSEAIKRRSTIEVAPIGTGWISGWIVSTSGGATLQRADQLSPDVTSLPSSPGKIVFGANGRVSSGVQTVTFYAAGYPSIAARCVGLNINGMPRSRVDSNKDPSDGCN